MIGMMWLQWVDGMNQSPATWAILGKIMAGCRNERAQRALILSL